MVEEQIKFLKQYDKVVENYENYMNSNINTQVNKVTFDVYVHKT